MLQQTRVETVLARWDAFIARFPNLHALAAALREEVLRLWQGLGYYRRAHALHEAARIIVREHAGRFPCRFEEILRLPGVGRSTAGAIASIAFGERRAVLDGNVRRVLVRWHGAQLAERELWRSAQTHLAAAEDPGDWNQAMMELGATVCLPRAPRCDACPARWCRSRQRPEKPLPRSPKARQRVVHLRVLLHCDAEKGVWLVPRPERGIWAGLWTPPLCEIAAPNRAPDLVHELTHRHLHLYAERVDAPPSGPGRWSREGAPMPTGIRKLLAKLGVAA